MEAEIRAVLPPVPPGDTLITIGAIHVAPVKSLALTQADTVYVTPDGIAEDRRFYLTDRRGALVTQREASQLVQIRADYRADPDWLRLSFPDGSRLEGYPELAEPVVTHIWGRHVRGRVVEGGWSAALSELCGEPVVLVRSDEPGQCYDEYPISVLSQASVEFLNSQPGAVVPLESRRFRPNFLMEGGDPHQEDSWLGKVIQIGPSLRLRVVARDPRCAITTNNPETGERDVDTLRIIVGYRPSPRAAYFGVYGTVEEPGPVSVGDPVISPV